jgi:hypothetical protein
LAVSVPVPGVYVLRLNRNGGWSRFVPVIGDWVATTVPFTERLTWEQLLYTSTVVGDVEVHWLAMKTVGPEFTPEITTVGSRWLRMK